MKLYQKLADEFRKSQIDNPDISDLACQEINKIIDLIPHGSGIDSETIFDFEKSNSQKLILKSAYHNLNENGYYDSRTYFKIVLSPSFIDFDLEIVSNFPKKYSSTKEYLQEIFYYSFNQDISSYPLLITMSIDNFIEKAKKKLSHKECIQ